MPDLKEPITLDDALGDETADSTAPEYLAWKKAKIAASLKRIENGEGRAYDVAEVRRRFGLEP